VAWGKVPRPQKGDLSGGDDAALIAAINGLEMEMETRFERFDVGGALEAVWVVVRATNRYLEVRAPWSLRKESLIIAHMSIYGNNH